MQKRNITHLIFHLRSVVVQPSSITWSCCLSLASRTHCCGPLSWFPSKASSKQEYWIVCATLAWIDLFAPWGTLSLLLLLEFPFSGISLLSCYCCFCNNCVILRAVNNWICQEEVLELTQNKLAVQHRSNPYYFWQLACGLLIPSLLFPISIDSVFPPQLKFCS